MHANALGKHVDKRAKNITKRRFILFYFLLVIDHFHIAVLLNPKLTNNDVVDTTGGVCPGVRFIISAETKSIMPDDATSK